MAISEIENKEQDEDGKVTTLLDNCQSILELNAWNMPFEGSIKAGFGVAEHLEKIAKGADVIVSTNLVSVRRAFRRQLVEYHNRGIGRLYLYMGDSTYEDASRLADFYKINLPVLEIDAKGKVVTGKLKWYKVKMDEIEADGKAGCDAFNLRYKESREEK